MTKTELAQVLAVLAAAYPRWEITPDLPVVYYELLSDIDGDTMKHAAKAWAMTEKHPPTIADLRAMCAEMTGALAPTQEEAWREVVRAITTHGYTRMPEWSDPAVERAVETIGWVEICHNTNVEATRAHFFKAYEGYRGRINRRILVSPALGGNFKSIDMAGVLKQLDEPS